MAGRVNVKFVVVLSVGLLLLFGAVAFAVWRVVDKAGEDYARLAVKFEDEGDWKQAARNWGRAVGHEPDNLEWLEAWFDAEQMVQPDTRLEYFDAYSRKYYLILRQIATLKRTDVEAHRKHLDARMAQLGTNPSTDLLEDTVGEVNRVLGLFADDSGAPLRRYRGELLTMLSAAGASLSEERVALAEEDLRAAMEAEPSSREAAFALYRWYQQRAEVARRARRPADVEEANARASEVLEGFVEANPDSAAGATALFGDRITRSLNGLDQTMQPAELAAAQRGVIDGFLGAFSGLTERLEGEWSDQVDRTVASSMARYAARIVPDQVGAIGRRMWDLAVANDPEDSQAMYLRAEFLALAGEGEDAIEAFTEVVELPDAPVGTEGLARYNVRPQASFRRATVAIEAWDRSEATGEEKAALLERAKRLRDEMAAERPETDAQLTLVDAKLAIADRDFNEADRLLRRYNEAVLSQDPEGLRLSGVVLRELGNEGAARSAFQTSLDLDQGNVFAVLSLADIARELRDYDEAARWLERAIAMRPNDATLRDQLYRVNVLRGTAEARDPEEQLRFEAQAALESGDEAGYIAKLIEGLDRFESPRFALALARKYAEQNRLDDALAATDRGLENAPENEELLRLRSLLGSGDPVEGAIAEIDADASLTDAQKAKRRFQVYQAARRPEDMLAALDAALALLPDDTDLLTSKFLYSLQEEDFATAESLIGRLSSADADGAGGRTYRARLAAVRGNYDEAERLLRAAAEEGSTSAETLQLLGEVLQRQGNTQASLDAFREAYEIRPNEVPMMVSYIDGLIRSQRLGEALEVARSGLAIGRSNPGFLNRWLSLEGEVGDRELALRERLNRAEADPTDLENRTRVVALLMQLGRYEEARRRLDALRGVSDSLALVTLDARWHAEQSDLNAARAVFANYLVDQGASIDSPDAYLAFGRFLLQNGDIEGGLATIRQGRRFQDAGDPLADLMLGTELFRLGRDGEAVEVYRSLVERLGETGSERVPALRLRLAETLIRLDRFEEAEEALSLLSGDEGGDALALLRADIARGRGNLDEAGRLLDAAVASSSVNQLALIKRAELRIEEGSFGDALADLDAALESDPNSTVALRLRATVRLDQGDERGGFEDIRRAVASAPDDVGLLLAAVGRFVQADRMTDATDLVEDALERRPTDLRLKVGAGDLFAGAGEHRRALTFFGSAWEQAPSLAVARRYVASLLEQGSPDYDTARRVANSPALSAEASDAGVQTLRARVSFAAGNRQQAFNSLDAAYDSLVTQVGQLGAWFGALPTVLDGTANAAEYAAGLSRRRELGPWARLFVAQMLASDEDTRADGIARLESYVESGVDQTQRLRGLQVLSIAYYNSERFEDAVEKIREALEIEPDNADLLNNLAFVLAVELDQGEEALRHARRAVELAPGRADVLDTLGMAELSAGEAAQSVETFRKALAMARSATEETGIRLHLARALLETGDRPGARELIDEARDVMRRDGTIEERYGERLAEVEGLL